MDRQQRWVETLRLLRQLRGEGRFRGKQVLLRPSWRIGLEIEWRRSEPAPGYVWLFIGPTEQESYFEAPALGIGPVPLSDFAGELRTWLEHAVELARQGYAYQRTAPAR
jgi:hypothetical protein|nr:MAG: hypothetical protein KatS3mg041_1463 [Bacteroidota bacterium]